MMDDVNTDLMMLRIWPMEDTMLTLTDLYGSDWVSRRSDEELAEIIKAAQRDLEISKEPDSIYRAALLAASSIWIQKQQEMEE